MSKKNYLESVRSYVDEQGYAEEITSENFVIPQEEDYVDFGEATEEWDISEAKPGLWENIRKKKEREGKKYRPAKPGDPDRPNPDAWKKAQKPKKTESDSKTLTEDVKKDSKKKYRKHMSYNPPSWKKAVGEKDIFDNPQDAEKRAKDLGIEGHHSHKHEKGKTIYMPGKSHKEYMRAIKKSKDQVMEAPEPDEDQGPSSGSYKYEDPKTGEIYNFKRRGVYKKNGRILIPVRGAEAHKAGPMEDYVFTSKDEAMKIAKKFDDLSDSIHTTKTGDGKTLYIPGKTEKEFKAWYKKHKGEDSKGYGLPKHIVDKMLKKKKDKDKSKSSEYQGRKVTLNKPFRTPDGPKKMSVYVKNEKGNVVKVNFGDPNMKIKKNIPERRKSFRARHNCDNPGPKWKARYWSCKAW